MNGSQPNGQSRQAALMWQQQPDYARYKEKSNGEGWLLNRQEGMLIQIKPDAPKRTGHVVLVHRSCLVRPVSIYPPLKSRLRAENRSMELKASFLEDAYPGVDFWEVEKTFALKVRVIAEAETPEEEPSVSFARAVLNKKLIGDVELPDEVNLWLADYFKRHPEAADMFDDMCKELVFKSGGKIAVDGATRGPNKALEEKDRISLTLKAMDLDAGEDR